MKLAGREVQAKTVSPAWCSNTLLRPSLLSLLTHHLLSSADKKKAPLEPCVLPLEPPALPGTPRLRGWREVACRTKGKCLTPCLTINQVSSWLDLPEVQEQKRRKSPLSLPLSGFALHPAWLPIPNLWEKPWSTRDVGTRQFTMP